MRQKRVNPLLQNFEEHGAAFNFCESGFPVEAVCRNSVFRLKINCAYVFLFERIFNSFHNSSRRFFLESVEGHQPFGGMAVDVGYGAH